VKLMCEDTLDSTGTSSCDRQSRASGHLDMMCASSGTSLAGDGLVRTGRRGVMGCCCRIDCGDVGGSGEKMAMAEMRER